jgi:hypothetical protein
MKISLIPLLLSHFSNALDQVELDELNDKAVKNSALFWTEQFSPFESTGFTKQMILGAKEIYFAEDFSQKMICFS